MPTAESTITPPFTHHRALILIRQRLNEVDAIAGVPLHIQADLEQLLVEAIDLPENSPCATGDYHEGVEEGITIGRRDAAAVEHEAGAMALELAGRIAAGMPSKDVERFMSFLRASAREMRTNGTITGVVG